MNTILAKLDYKSIFKKGNLLFIAGLVGILLIFASDFFASEKKQTQTNTTTAYSTEYEKQLEARLEAIIESIDGAGKAKVMLTLEGGSESIYAVNETHDTQSSEGTYTESYQSEHVLVDGTGGSEALLEATLAPEVKGAAVVCEGAGDIAVQKRIIDTVSAVLGISTNRICVTKMTN